MIMIIIRFCNMTDCTVATVLPLLQLAACSWTKCNSHGRMPSARTAPYQISIPKLTVAAETDVFFHLYFYTQRERSSTYYLIFFQLEYIVT